MRFPAVLAALASLALAVPAAAQDPDGEPGCVEANPCDLIIAVDAEGFDDLSETEFTEGDWLVATVVNHDESAAHTVTLHGHALDIEVPAGDIDDSEPFRIGKPGRYVLSDLPSNDVADVQVVAADEFDDGATDDEAGNGIPGIGLAALVAGLAVAVAVARRLR